MQDETSQLVDELDELLEAERSALLAGRIDRIARLVDRKADLIVRLSDIDFADTEKLAGIQRKVLRNQDLLGQAAAGIRKVATRLSALRQVRSSLDTYDERGMRRRVDMDAETSFEKRA
ncbi:flagellar biosynthesis protein FlgN [Sulfitobacter sp. LCG007]